MQSASRLGKSVHDPDYAEFVAKLRQKAENTGTHIIQAAQWLARAKLCTMCGYKNSALRLHERTWTCPNCSAEHSRDENAGKNLRNVGLDILNLGKPSEPVEKVISRRDSGSYAVFCKTGSPSAFTDG